MEGFDEALAGIREALQSDGYDMRVKPEDGGRLTIEVTAGPDACVECLIPRDMFEQMVQSALGGTGDVSIVYPA